MQFGALSIGSLRGMPPKRCPAFSATVYVSLLYRVAVIILTPFSPTLRVLKDSLWNLETAVAEPSKGRKAAGTAHSRWGY